jgi:hypothetical protein
MIQIPTSEFLITSVAYLSAFLLIAALLAFVLQLRRRNRIQRAIVMFVCAFVLFIPIKHLTIAAYLRTFFQTLSITSLLLLADYLISQLFKRTFIPRRERRIILIIIALVGIFFYPLTLGFTIFDPYQLGFNSILFALALLVLTFICLITKRNATAICLIAAALAFDSHLLASNNLWDYIIDPLLTLYALVWCITKVVSTACGSGRVRE